ncbi:uncharacterized protein B0I36DRAFT_342265 [Microdochium trichocladiopsis]|uniref:Uncharacterized protein n=1 Tax=Microdochium trichocladiopsis TaxID=1682393 RepID=A0A9P8XPU8_9PEZI|nr:uncharacterized protein B0I36DRAFT_342265 [Microdochium trichocladiopsis]KAH7009400.1 hypothetical protein B0I36DRAFT_342265 [Microdochium trichocladiopsis]
MCTKTVSVTIYTCGDRFEEDVSFDSCDNTSAAGHSVTTKHLGSSRKRTKCGRFNCSNP